MCVCVRACVSKRERDYYIVCDCEMERKMERVMCEREEGVCVCACVMRNSKREKECVYVSVINQCVRE